MSALKQTQTNATQTKQRFWNIVWRAAFMVLGDEDKAERIANEAANPSAVKDDVIVPDSVSAPNRETWVCVYKAACDNCEEDQAKSIADEVCTKCDAGVNEGTKSVVDKNTSYSFSVDDNRLILQKNGGTIKLSRSIKSADNNSPEEGWVEGYLVSWGSTKDTDLQGEFFSPRTEFCLDWFGERPVLYHHGMDDSTGLKKIGVFKTIKVDNIGLWVQAQLDLRDRYARAVYDMVAAKQFGWSSGSVDHLVKIGENGEILVWPLIEGSITPTPAQPAKTAVRPIKAVAENGNQFKTIQAFKAVLSDDVNSSEYLRGLDEHISSADVSELLRRASARVATQKTIATRTKNHNGFREGDSTSMARNTESAWYITRAVAKAFGIKDASPEELNAVANEVQGVVQDEVDAAAAQALEDEAKAADAEAQASATASYNRNRQQLRGQAMRQAQVAPESTAQVDPNAPVASYSTRQVGAPIPVAPAAMQDPEQESTAQDPNSPATVASYGNRRAMRQVAPAETPADTIEAAMMNEFAAQMEDEQMEQKAARALRQRAWKRAMRQITDMPADSTMQDDAQLADEMIAQYDTTGNTPVSPGDVDVSNTADGMTIASYNQARARRNVSTRQVTVPATQQDPNAPIAQVQDPVMAAMMADADEDAVESDATMQEQIISDVATASYRRGYRSGLRSAYRQVDPDAGKDDELAQAADAEVNEEVASLADQGADDDVVAQAARAYRAGYRKGLRRAVRQLEQEVDSDKADDESAETSKQASIVPDGTLSYGARGYVDPRQQKLQAQRYAQLQAQRGYGYRQVGDPNAPVMQDPNAPIAQFQQPIMQDQVLAPSDTIAQYDPAMAQYDPAMAQYDPAMAQYDQAMAQYDAQMDDEMIAQYDTTQPTPVSPGPVAPATMLDPSILPPGSATASYGGRGQRVQYPQYAAQRGYAYRQLDPSIPADPNAAMQDAVIADQLSGAQMADVMDSTAQYSQLSDDQTISGVTPVRNYNPQAFRSANFDGGAAYEAQRQAEYWKQRATQLETMEASNQRAFKSLGVNSVKDVADRPGAYNSAFKSYLMKGLGLMTDTEKYILTGKGKARWENASFAYDTATKSVKTYSSGSDASVGFLVPEDWVNELNTNVMTQTVMAPECKTRTTTSDRIVQPNLNTTDARRAHPAQVRWPGESPASNTDHRTVEDEYTQVTIPIHVMLITLAATNSALEDATFNLEEEINEAFAEAVAVSYDQLIWGGDGQGKLQGIVTNTQVTGSPSLGMKTVGGYVATGSTDGIVTADTLKTMLFHLPQGYRQRAKWYMNSNTGLQISTLKDGMGNYLIDQRDDALRTVGVPDRLLNHPIVYNEWADDADSGNFPVVLADLTKGYIIGRRVEFSIRRFDDSNYAEHDQVLFLGRARLGGQVLQPAAFKTLKVALS